MRFTNQTVITFNGSSVRSKNVRRATPFLVELLGGAFLSSYRRKIMGVARIDGLEIPVRRIANRVWKQVGEGLPYDAHGLFSRSF